ncbi:MAG: hypothetical protein ACREK1_01635, partial [Longimicrobiales bacterium]
VTPRPAPPPVTQQPPEAPAPRPETRLDTVMVEGTAEVEESRLVTAPAGFAVPFSTYVPVGLQSDIQAPSTVRFTAAFAGNVNRNAYMEVFVYPDGAARPHGAAILDRLMSERAAAEHENVPAERPSWAREATGFRYIGSDGINFTGSITVGQHGDSYFHVIRHYPVEYGDGLPPRLHTILRHWRWEDDGRMLMR